MLSTDQTSETEMEELAEVKQTGFAPIAKLKALIAHIKANKKKLFWYWITYHCIKGALTTSLIWVPMLYVWLK